MTKVRRLFAQAYATHTTYIAKLDDPAPDKACHLHVLDREAAILNLRSRITDFTIDNETEPSCALTDKFNTILMTGKSNTGAGKLVPRFARRRTASTRTPA